MQNLVLTTMLLTLPFLGWPFKTAYLWSEEAPRGEDGQDLAAVRLEQALLPAAAKRGARRVGRRHQALSGDAWETDGAAGWARHAQETGLYVSFHYVECLYVGTSWIEILRWGRSRSCLRRNRRIVRRNSWCRRCRSSNSCMRPWRNRRRYLKITLLVWTGNRWMSTMKSWNLRGWMINSMGKRWHRQRWRKINVEN